MLMFENKSCCPLSRERFLTELASSKILVSLSLWIHNRNSHSNSNGSGSNRNSNMIVICAYRQRERERERERERVVWVRKMAEEGCGGRGP